MPKNLSKLFSTSTKSYFLNKSFLSNSGLLANSDTNNKQAEEKKISKKKLPDLWTLSEEITNNLPNLKYCFNHHSFYFYFEKELIWKAIDKTEVNNLIIKLLKTLFPDLYKDFQPRRLEDLLIILESETRFSLLAEKTKADSEGLLIPFKNGILNSKTKIFLSHDPKYYCTHIIAEDFDPEAEIEGTPLAYFLVQFVNKQRHLLNLLRAYLNIIFTNNTRYQLAFYIYGPGGTGKSTLINLLLYLLGPEASLSTTLNNLNSRFGLSRITHKIFLVINDMTHYKGKEPKILKELITGDVLESEKKYKDAISIIPHIIITITGNSIWELINPTGGINRRIVYFPAEHVPEIKDFDLFNIDSIGAASGKLTKDLPAFINWILSCPQEYLDSLEVGGEVLTKYINPNNLITSHHLSDWVTNYLISDHKSKLQVGNKNSNKDTLYGNYLNWCIVNNIEPIKINRFSELLSDQFKSLKWETSKKRTSLGFFFYGIKFRNLNENTNKLVDTSTFVNKKINLGLLNENYNWKINKKIKINNLNLEQSSLEEQIRNIEMEKQALTKYN